MCKCNTSSNNTEMQHPQQNPAECFIQLYKIAKKSIHDHNGSPSYVWLYSLFLWIGISNFFWLNPPMETYMILKLPFSQPLTSASLWTTYYETLVTNMIHKKHFLATRINVATRLAIQSI